MTKVMRVPRHRARISTRRRVQVVLGGGLAIVAVIVAVGYVLGRGSDPPARATAADSPTSPQSSPARSAAPRPSPPSPSKLTTTPSGTASAGHGTRADQAAASVLAAINAARSEAGLPAYTLMAGLRISARRHNLLVADGCGLSHECPGEPALGTRETAAGVQWTAAGENIGEGGPVADTTAAITQMAVALTQDMLAERPPDNGHRLNILSSTFTKIGIAIYRAGNGMMWMTQDFAN